MTPHARPRIPAEAPSIINVWKLQSTANALTLTVDQYAGLLRTPSPITPGKGAIYWNLQWDVLPRWVNYFKPLHKGELISTGIPLPSCTLDLLKCTRNEHVPLKEARKWGSWPAIS